MRRLQLLPSPSAGALRAVRGAAQEEQHISMLSKSPKKAANPAEKPRP